eukprot:14887916-Heterocapsa_arctica.AAC.1
MVRPGVAEHDAGREGDVVEDVTSDGGAQERELASVEVEEGVTGGVHEACVRGEVLEGVLPRGGGCGVPENE